MENKEEGVKIKHPEYEKRSPQWCVMRDVMEGDDTIKAKGETYLPRPSTAHKKYDMYENMQYERFKDRGIFTDFTAQIHDCLHGMIESRPANIDVPQNMKGDKFLVNVDNQGNSADQFFSDSLSDVLVTGFGGILVDLPKVNPNMSVKEAENKGIRPYLSYYTAESIVNWKYKSVGGVKTLSLVVLEEEVDSAIDEFSHTTNKRYRVLSLVNNVYTVTIYTETQNQEGKTEITQEKPYPVLVNGNTLNYIPFIMLPFNGPVKPILYDIAKLNIHHYQVTADYQNGAHLTSRPSLYFTGHAPEKDKEGNPIPIYIGADVVWQLEESEAKVGVCSFSGEGIQHLENALTRDEAQIITLASHIIAAEKKTAENKDAMNIRRAGEDAKLATYAKYMSYRFTQALQIVSDWLGNEGVTVTVSLNSDFSNLSFDANAVNSIANIFSRGKLPLRSLWYLLYSSGYLEPGMSYEDFIYLLDMEAASLSPTEVNEAYKMYKRSGKQLKLPKKDWYSPEEDDKKKVFDEKTETEEPVE